MDQPQTIDATVKLVDEATGSHAAVEPGAGFEVGAPQVGVDSQGCRDAAECGVDVDGFSGTGRVEEVVEAGTGVGKTFAYLVPALLSGERVLLSTATKTLQDQLFARDIPDLLAALGLPLRWGRSGVGRELSF